MAKDWTTKIYYKPFAKRFSFSFFLRSSVSDTFCMTRSKALFFGHQTYRQNLHHLQNTLRCLLPSNRFLHVQHHFVRIARQFFLLDNPRRYFHTPPHQIYCRQSILRLGKSFVVFFGFKNVLLSGFYGVIGLELIIKRIH